jgi:hypothetical protein
VSDPNAFTRLVALLFGAVLVMACVQLAPAGQSGGTSDLSDTLRDHIKAERFQAVTSVRGFPLGVRDGLQTLFGNDKLDIVDVDAKFHGTDPNADPKLPLRRLVASGCSDDHCLVYYERADTRTWLVALFSWTPDETRFEWGGNARAGLTTVDEVRAAVVSGEIKGPVSSW